MRVLNFYKTLEILVYYILEPLELIQNYYGEIEHNRMFLQNNCQSRKSILAK